eukprot:131854-Rhodomonas_salina.1
MRERNTNASAGKTKTKRKRERGSAKRMEEEKGQAGGARAREKRMEQADLADEEADVEGKSLVVPDKDDRLGLGLLLWEPAEARHHLAGGRIG